MKIAYEIIETADGSPSFVGETEAMHNRAGAYTETQYIYGEAIRSQIGANIWRVLVVGLGLGYIELLAAAESVKQNKPLELLSYEADPNLVEAFLRWLSGKDSVYSQVYDRILSFLIRDYACDGAYLKAKLYGLYEDKKWKIRGYLTPESLPSEMKYNIILYDAFSGKSTPDVWTPEFLEKFLVAASAPDAVFATYACTGVLKRALAAAGFEVEKRPGFSGKRDCTFATRER